MAHRQVNFDASSRNFSEIHTANSWIQLSNLVLLDLGQLEEVKDTSDILFDLQFLPGLVEKVDQFFISGNLKYLYEPYLKNKIIHTLQVDFLKKLCHLILNCRIACSIWHNDKVLSSIPPLARDTRIAFKQIVLVRKEIEVSIAKAGDDLKTRPGSFLSVHPQIIRTKLLAREESGSSMSTNSTVSSQNNSSIGNENGFKNLNRAYSPVKWNKKDDELPEIRPEDSISRKGSMERIRVNFNQDNIDMIVTEADEEMEGHANNHPNIRILNDEGFQDDDAGSFVISELSDWLIEKTLKNRADTEDLINYIRTYEPKSQLSFQREGIESGFQTPLSQQLSRQSSQVQLKELGISLNPDFVDPDIEFQILFGRTKEKVDHISVKDATITKWALSKIAQEWAFDPVEHLLNLFNLSIDSHSKPSSILDVLEKLVIHMSPMLALMETLGQIYEAPDLTAINSDDTDFDLCREFFIRREAIYSELFDVFNLCEEISIEDSKENRQSLTIFVIGTIKSYEELIMVFRCLTRNRSMMQITSNSMDDLSKLDETKVTIEVTQLKEAMDYLIGMNDLKREQAMHANDPNYLKNLIENTPNYLDDSMIGSDSISNSQNQSLLTRQSTEFGSTFGSAFSSTNSVDKSTDVGKIEDDDSLFDLPDLDEEKVDLKVEDDGLPSKSRSVQITDLSDNDPACIKRMSTETYKAERTPIYNKRNSTMTLGSDLTAFQIFEEHPAEDTDNDLLNPEKSISRVVSDPTHDFSLLKTPDVEDIKSTIGKALEGVRNQHMSLPVKSKGVMIDPLSGKEVKPPQVDIKTFSVEIPEVGTELQIKDDNEFRYDNLPAHSELNEEIDYFNLPKNKVRAPLKKDICSEKRPKFNNKVPNTPKVKEFPLKVPPSKTIKRKVSYVSHSFSTPPIGILDKIFWHHPDKRRNSFSNYYDTIKSPYDRLDQRKELINKIKQKIDYDPNQNITVSRALAHSKVQLWLQTIQDDPIGSISFPETKPEGIHNHGLTGQTNRQDNSNGLISKISEFLNTTGDCLIKICSSIPNLRDEYNVSSSRGLNKNDCTIVSKKVITRRHSFSTLSDEASSSSNFLFYYMGRWLNLNWLRLRLLGSFSDYTTWEPISKFRENSAGVSSQALDHSVKYATHPNLYLQGLDDEESEAENDTESKSKTIKNSSMMKLSTTEYSDSTNSEKYNNETSASKYKDLFELDDEDLEDLEDLEDVEDVEVPANVKIANFASSSGSEETDTDEVVDQSEKSEETQNSQKLEDDSSTDKTATSRFLFKKLSFMQLPPIITPDSGLEEWVKMISNSESFSEMLNSSSTLTETRTNQTLKSPAAIPELKSKGSTSKNLNLKIKPSIPRFRVAQSPRHLKSFDLKLSPGLLSPYSTYKFCSDISKSPSSVNSIESKFNSPSTVYQAPKKPQQYNVISSDVNEAVPMEKIKTLTSLMDYNIDIMSGAEPSNDEASSISSLSYPEALSRSLTEDCELTSPKAENDNTRVITESSGDEWQDQGYIDSSDDGNNYEVTYYSDSNEEMTTQFTQADTEDEADDQNYASDSSAGTYQYSQSYQCYNTDQNQINQYQYEQQYQYQHQYEQQYQYQHQYEQQYQYQHQYEQQNQYQYEYQNYHQGSYDANLNSDYYTSQVYQDQSDIYHDTTGYSYEQEASRSNQYIPNENNIYKYTAPATENNAPHTPSPTYSQKTNSRTVSNFSHEMDPSMGSNHSNNSMSQNTQELSKQFSSKIQGKSSSIHSSNVSSAKQSRNNSSRSMEHNNDFSSLGNVQVSKLRESSSYESSNMQSVVSTSISDAQMTTTTSDGSPQKAEAKELKVSKSVISQLHGKGSSNRSSLKSENSEKLSTDSISETLNKLSEKISVSGSRQNSPTKQDSILDSELKRDSTSTQVTAYPAKDLQNEDKNTNDASKGSKPNSRRASANGSILNNRLVESPRNSIHSRRRDSRNSVEMKSSKHNSITSVKSFKSIEKKTSEENRPKSQESNVDSNKEADDKRSSNKPEESALASNKVSNGEDSNNAKPPEQNPAPSNEAPKTTTTDPPVDKEIKSKEPEAKSNIQSSATFPPPQGAKKRQPMSKIRNLLKFRKLEDENGPALTYIAPHGAEFKAGQPIPPNPHYARRNTIANGQPTRSNTAPVQPSKPSTQPPTPASEAPLQPKPVTINKSESSGPSIPTTAPIKNSGDQDDGSKTPPLDKKSVSKRSSMLSLPESDQKWYLGHNYEESDIVFKEGLIFSSTIEALVERLTLHSSSVDSNLIKTFMLTYRAFCKSDEFLDLLISRFNIQPPPILTEEEYEDWKTKKQSLIRIRVNNLLKTWLESYFYEADDGMCIEKMIEFAKNDMIPQLPAAGQRIFSLAEELNIKLKQSQVAAKLTKSKNMDLLAAAALAKLPNIPPPLPELPKNVVKALLYDEPFRITDMSPLEIARQFTIMDCRNFCGIRPHELIGLEFSKKNSSSVYYVRMMTDATNEITSLICGSILKELNIKKRAKLIAFFIDVGEQCLTLRNYNSLMPIVGSLSCAMVSRLKKTWALLQPRSVQILEGLRKCINHSKNYADYRNNLKKTFPPCIPFLGIYLTDLTFTDEGNEAIKKEGNKKYVNFAKYYRIVKIIEEIQKFQAPYNLIEVVELQQRLKTWMQVANDCWHEDEFYKRSLLLEPRDPNQQPITQNLASKSTVSPITMKETEYPETSLAYF